jgi:hypothetical protein
MVTQGTPAEVAARLKEAITITTFSTGATPVLTGSVEFPRVELYRSRPPMRGIRSHTYFKGELRGANGNTTLEGRIETSAVQATWFGVMVAGWALVAALMVIASVASRNWTIVAVGVPLASVVGLAVYGFIRIGLSTVKAESELLEQEIEGALQGEHLTTA